MRARVKRGRGLPFAAREATLAVGGTGFGGAYTLKTNKLRPEPDIAYRVNTWFCRLMDFFFDPRRRLKNVPLKEGMVVVDYACGPGRHALPVAKLVGPEGKVYAVDIQPLAISTVKKRAARQGTTNIEAILVDSYDTGIQSSTADLVLLLDALHQIGDCDALFREIHRLLKPAGILFMGPGHMEMSKAKEIVEGTGLFTITECLGRDMLVAPKSPFQ